MPLVFVAVVSDTTIRCATGFWQAAAIRDSPTKHGSCGTPSTDRCTKHTLRFLYAPRSHSTQPPAIYEMAGCTPSPAATSRIQTCKQRVHDAHEYGTGSSAHWGGSGA